MKKLCILFLPLLLLANSIDPALLEIEAKLFTKIIFLDKEIDKKLLNQSVTIAIITEPQYIKEAKFLHKLLNNKKLFGNTIVAHIYSTIPKNIYTAYIILDDNDRFKQYSTKLLQKRRLIFSVLPHTIDEAMISVVIDHKIYPLLNAKNIKAAKLKLNPILFKVARFYEKN